MNHPFAKPPARDPEGRGLHDLSEDATGFGVREWRTARDSLLRPAAMLDGYMTQGPDAGGAYTRPLRFYLSLCGLLMLQMFLMGGTSFMIAGLPPQLVDPLIAESGKSRDAFLADADDWMALFIVPVNSVLYALIAAPLLRWWDPADLGWRRSFRATFHYLNVWTLPFVPLGFFAYSASTAGWASALLVVLGFIGFLRAGKGRWYSSPAGGLMKSAVITALTFLSSVIATLPLMAIGLAAGRWG